MKVKDLKKILNNFDDELEVFTEKHEAFGNLGNIFFVVSDEYSTFGTIKKCLVLTDYVDNKDNYMDGVKNEKTFEQSLEGLNEKYKALIIEIGKLFKFDKIISFAKRIKMKE